MLPLLAWAHPGLAAVRGPGERVAAAVAARPGPGAVAWALNAEADAGVDDGVGAEPPVRFVPQADLPAGEAYERFIVRTRQVPTRDLAHDFFNGLVWLTQPALKWRLAVLHAQALAAHGVGGRRGPLRDALTLVDEHGAWLQAPPLLLQALQRRDWPALFVQGAGLWPQARLHLVGHALLEKLATAPRKGLTAQVLLGRGPAGPQAVDPLALPAAAWAAKPLAPLPLAGIPGWWAAGPQDAAFYADAAVFRPPRAVPAPAASGGAIALRAEGAGRAGA